MLLSASLSAQPAQDSAADAASRTARLEGQVLSQTGEPLRKATLRLAPYYADRSSNAVSYTDTTDGTGKFVFEGGSVQHFEGQVLSVAEQAYLAVFIETYQEPDI